jgi:uncharacterized protein
MEKLTAAISGLLFGIGLTISGMVNPMKVLNFLDVLGTHDFTLVFVMGGGLITALIGYQLLFKRGRPFFADRFDFPTSQIVDAKLVSGAALFGIGWGITGICPGPAIAGLVFGNSLSFIFVVAMAIGIIAARFSANARIGV